VPAAMVSGRFMPSPINRALAPPGPPLLFVRVT